MAQPEFFEALNKAIDAESRWTRGRATCGGTAIHDAAPWLCDPFVEENFNFYNATLQGAKELQPRWKRCTAATDTSLGEAAGAGLGAEELSSGAKEKHGQAGGGAREGAGEDIKHARLDGRGDAEAGAGRSWTRIATRSAIRRSGGTTTTLKVERGDLLATSARGGEFETQRNLDKIGKPVDRDGVGA